MPAVLFAIWALFALSILSSRLGFIRLRMIVAAAVVLAAWVGVRALRRGWRPKPVPAVAVILVFQLLLLGWASLRLDVGLAAFALAQHLLLTGLGWLVWVESRGRPVRPAKATDLGEPRAWMLALVCVGCAALAVAFRAALVAPLVAEVDEVLFRMQARALAGAATRYVIGPDIAGAFHVPGLGYPANTMIPLYPTGWAHALAWADRLGIEAWLGTAATVCNVLLTAWLATSLVGRRAGLLAAAAFALNPLTVRFGPTYLGHSLALTFLLAGLIALQAALATEADRMRRAAACFAGAAFVIAFLTRPLVTLAIGLSAIVWLFLRSDDRAGRVRGTAPALAAGAVLVIAAALLYDPRMLTRSWLPMALDWRAVRPGAVAALPPAVVALGELVKVTWFSFGAVGTFALLGFLLLSGVPVRPRVLIVFSALPVILWLVHRPLVGDYTAAAPFLALAFAWSVLELAGRNWQLARATAALVLAGSLLASVLLLFGVRQQDPAGRQLRAAVDSARQEHERILILVDPNVPQPYAMKLWTYNLDGLEGDVLVARRTDPLRDARLHARFADRDAMLLQYDRSGWQLTRMPGPDSSETTPDAL